MKVLASPKFREKFGNTLRKFRENKKISQKEMARRTGFSHTYFSHIESGDRLPTLAALVLFAKVLEVSVWKFLWHVETDDKPYLQEFSRIQTSMQEGRLGRLSPAQQATIQKRRAHSKNVIPKFQIVTREGSLGIKCFTCGLTSWNSGDVRAKFCNKCRVYHVDDKPI